MIDKPPGLTETESPIQFESVADEVTADPEFLRRLTSVDALILPFRDLPSYEKPVFPAVTRDLYQFLTRNAGGKLEVEVATEAEEIEELVLHGDLLVLGVLLVKAAAANVALGLLTNFIYEKIRRKAGDPESTTVRCELIIEDANGSRSLKYDGPASAFERLVGSGVNKGVLRPGQQARPTDDAPS